MTDLEQSKYQVRTLAEYSPIKLSLYRIANGELAYTADR